MDFLDSALLILLALFCAAIIAGFIDTLVGGGGLITIPALMAAGLPPIYALGTNKLQAVGGSGTAAITLFLKRQFTLTEVAPLMVAAFIGAIVGTLIVHRIDTEQLDIIVPIVILAIAIYFLLAPSNSLQVRNPRVTKRVYGLTAVPAIGVYDGMFGPATGSFFVLAGSSLRGQEVVSATKIAKPLNFATNAASLSTFIVFGTIYWQYGLVMLFGQFIGARIGASLLMTINPNVLRGLVIALCVVMLSVQWLSSS
ncbi:MAG: TSUP family transporter [Pseudomonadota bacterium]